MIRKDGKYPANARVDVDYSKGKPKIKFTYPKNGDNPKKQAIKQNSLGPIGLTLLLLIVGIPFMIAMFYENPYSVDYPKECNVSLDNNYLNMSWYTDVNGKIITINKYKKWVEGANFTCGNKTYLVEFNKYVDKKNMIEVGFKFKSQLSLWERTNNALMPVYVFIISFILWIFINRRITKYLIKQKWYQKWLPKHEAEGWLNNKRKKYIKFTPEDIENNIAEIHCFKNVILDYKTEGDFSDKLERIKIREHQYNKYKKGKIGKREIRLFEWYARFYFKEKPKDGYLEVIYR